ncbi:MAG: tetratricopeptide repeat protein [Candidatus Eisenbacteria bacterium]|nr:tetratricopeptide repeat protein [Candidatus Eisenbacteria bacterium]
MARPCGDAPAKRGMRGPAGVAAAVFLLAWVARFIYVLHLRSSPLADVPMLDELYHVEWARTLAAGNWIGSSVFFRAPLYPYLLGLVFRLFDGSLHAARIVQITYGSLTPVVVYFIARRLRRNAWALGAGVVAALYPFFFYFDNELLIVSLIVLLDVLAILLLLRADEHPTWGRWAVAGLVLGLSAIARPNILVFAPFVLLWTWWSERRRVRDGTAPDCEGSLTSPLVCSPPWRAAVVRFAVLAGVVLAVVSPVTIRNYVLEDDLVLIASQGGVNFYIGNNPRSDGIAAVLPELGEAWEYEDAVRLAERDVGRELKPSEASAWWYARGREFLRERPGQAARLYLKKLVLFWDRFELANNKDIYYFGAHSPLFRSLSWLSFGLVAPFGILGMAALFRRRTAALLGLFVLSYMGGVLLFFVNARYRLPIVPALIVLAVAGAAWLVERIREGDLRRVVPALLALAALFVVVNVDFYGTHVGDRAQTHNTIGLAHAERGRYAEAVEAYRRSLELSPGYAGAMNNMGLALEEMGREVEAAQAYRSAAATDTTLATAPNNLGVLLWRRGELEAAIRAFEEAIARDPALPEARVNLGSVLLGTGRLQAARSQLESAVGLNPSFAEAWNLLGVVNEQLDRPAPAIESYARAVSLAPGFTEARNNLGIVLARTGQYREALRELEIGLRYDPGDERLLANIELVRRLMRGER